MTSKIDIPTQSWIDHFPDQVRPYLVLMRADRPIGTWLLLIPCLWTLFLAAEGWPHWSHIFLFAIGAFVMRGAGCVMNDLADRDFDGQVERTATRPIPNGDVTPKQAALFMGLLCLVGLAVLIQFNLYTVILGVVSLGLVVLYPFCKRWTYWPQAILGLTFNWGALLGWCAVQGTIGWPAVCFYFAGLFWTLGYDTIYAHQDREDDKMVGIKSTALILGSQTRNVLWIFYGLTLGLITLGGYLAELGSLFYLGLVLSTAHLIWQILRLDIDDAQNCLMLFKSNKYFGLIILFDIVLGKIPV